MDVWIYFCISSLSPETNGCIVIGVINAGLYLEVFINNCSHNYICICIITPFDFKLSHALLSNSLRST
jgi:hypothetical protein